MLQRRQGHAAEMTTKAERLIATYGVRCDASDIERRAETIALEQSVELPLDAIDDERVRTDIVGQVLSVEERASGGFDVRIALAAETAPPEPGQLLNILFGNTSLHGDVALRDVEFPESYLRAFGGPRIGFEGLRRKLTAHGRAMTASALKPQGLSSGDLARLAGRLAVGGLDIVKDDHGLADQVYSPFAERVPACAAAVRDASRATGRRTLYAPSLSGDLDQLRAQLRIAREEGLEAVVVAPLLIGLPAFYALAREAKGIALLTHPSMGGAARVAPPFLLGRLFRLLGADATIFPNYGGRFAYSASTCRRIAQRALEPWGNLSPAAPMPAGGMTLDRVPELLDFYGRDCILLIGGGLLAARGRITQECAAFVNRVCRHG